MIAKINTALMMYLHSPILRNGQLSWFGADTPMADELKSRFMRARLAAIVEHELREGGSEDARSHVAIVPRLGYLVTIGNGDSTTIRLVQD